MSGLPFSLWYHEIVLCGVSKISLSLRKADASKEKPLSLLIFESYFGLMIKFVIPAGLTLLMSKNMAKDFTTSYNDHP